MPISIYANGVDNSSDPAINIRFTYTGREFDSEIKMYFYRARYYDRRLGRFIQEDPYPGNLSNPMGVTNKYIYVFNNPHNFIDPTGFEGTGSSSTTVGGIGSGYCCSSGRNGTGSNPWQSRDKEGKYTQIGSTYQGSNAGAIVVGLGFNASIGESGIDVSSGVYSRRKNKKR